MSSRDCILAIDQGTTSSRAMVFDATGLPLAVAQREFRQIYPHEGWVEHDPEEIWSTTVETCREVLASEALRGRNVAGIGITNQRETTLVWERATGKPIYNAIVWQDRRTADRCDELRAAGHEDLVAARTGLLLDPYFSATKIAWMLEHVDGARAAAERGELAFGTVDTFLLWRLTGGRVHATDATNASRTLLFDIHRQQWDDELLDLFGVPRALLPEVRDSSADFGTADASVLGRALPVAGIAGDQQAATIGQACFQPGMIKSTYGTGCFVVLNTGTEAVASRNRLLTTVAYRLGGETTYALEGSIFVAGAAVQWLRDGIRAIENAPQTESLAAGLADNQGVYLVPAFTGLGAPHWDARARGAIFGITR
ncbi:MAG: glycerol kinase, partial [Gammaproteobacteria bacterium]|nr:glycerol kinase [Gammaproteobacteria bacterium]